MAHIFANSKTGEPQDADRWLRGFRRKSAWRNLLLIAAGLLTCTSLCHALEPTSPLASYARQSWVMENGLPQNTVQALVQSRDGFLWLGTEAGLVRFDGNGFVLFDQSTNPALPGNDVRCLFESHDGALWVGTSEGLARWKDGAAASYTTKEGLPGNGIHGLAETTDGVLWAWTNSGLARFQGGHFETATVADGLPPGAITSMASDGAGYLWVGTTVDAASWRAGEWSALAGGRNGNGRSLVTPGPGGTIEITNALGASQLRQDQVHGLASIAALPADPIEFLVFVPGGLGAANKSTFVVLGSGRARVRLNTGKELPGTRIQAVFTDRKGSVWIGTNGGLVRWDGGELQRLPVTDPLATASVLTVMEDREGNIWVGTETSGLHILRDERFRTIGTREGLSSDATTTVVEDGAGTLWVGTAGSGLNAVARSGTSLGKVKPYTVRDGLLSDVILSLATARNGDLWVGTPDGLNRIRRSKVDSFTSADGLPDDFIRSLLVDKDGSLWIGTRRGLTHWTGGAAMQMETFTQASGLGSDLVGAMERDSNGALWVATLAGLSRLQGENTNFKITNYTSANGLSSNVVTALLPREMGTFLVGTQDHGWNLWDGKRFTAVARNGLDRTTVHAILDDRSNHLWFATGNGIARCDCDMTGGCSNWIEFGPADGLRSRETATNSHPSAWRSADGMLWFATPKGLVFVDPTHFPINAVPPPVALVRFSVDDLDQPLNGGEPWPRVSSGHVHFQFEYAGLSFSAPQKVRYRYMLEGFDHQWTEAGTRRAAYYTNIPPGRYTFRVQAANNDGLWNRRGAAFQFELRPHFYQTIWFYVLLAVFVAALVVLLLKLRLLRAEREFRAVLGERNRIAREVHDTLAQGYVGVSVQLEVLSELLRQNKPDAAARHLDTTRGYVREGLAEARQSIWALRSQDSGENTLPVKLRRVTEQAGGNGIESSFSLFGAYRPIPGETEREFLRVAQEAIHNVKKHAGAKHLFVQLEYGPAEIALIVRDDGRGFEVEDGAESPLGHYGLTGMRERAEAIAGVLEVLSEPGGGTTVRLQAPVPKETKEQGTRERSGE